MNEWKVQMGIPKPDTAEAAALEGSTDGMRRAIMRASRDSPIVRSCMMAADHQGSSGEDRYVLLAYQALRALEDFYQQHVQLVNLTPFPRYTAPSGGTE